MCYPTADGRHAMRRRQFIATIASTAAWPIMAHGQGGPSLVGFMSGRSPADSSHLVAAFREGLKQIGFVEGQNLAIEFRWANGRYDQLPELATQLVARQIAVLTAVG